MSIFNPSRPANEPILNRLIDNAKVGEMLYVGSNGYVLLRPEDAAKGVVPVTERILKHLSRSYTASPGTLLRKCGPFLNPETGKTTALGKKHFSVPSERSELAMRKVEKDRSFRGTMRTSEAKGLVKHQHDGKYLFYLSKRSGELRFAFKLGGDVHVHPIEIEHGRLYAEDKSFSGPKKLTEGFIEHPRPILTQAPSFFLEQLDRNTTETLPEDVLKERKEGACCLTRDVDHNRFLMYVVEKGIIKTYPVIASNNGIEVDIQGFGPKLGPFTRLHDLFERHDFPANYIHYERSPKIREELYYWDLLPKMWKGETEWVKSSFGKRRFYASDTGLLGVRTSRIVAAGSYSRLFAFSLLPTSARGPDYLISVSKNKYTPEEFERKVVTTIAEAEKLKSLKRELKARNVTLKHCLLPTLVEQLHPKKDKDRKVFSAVLRAPGGDLFETMNRGVLSTEGRFRALMDILSGIEELNRIIVDLKLENIVCFSNDPDDPQIKLIDLGGSFPADEIPKSFTITPQYTSPSIVRRYRIADAAKTPHGILAEDFKKNHLFAWGAVAYEVCNPGYEAAFGRRNMADFARADPLDLNTVANDRYFNPEIAAINPNGVVVWKHPDSMERLVWDAIMWEQATDDGKIAQRLTLKDAKDRLRAIVATQGYNI